MVDGHMDIELNGTKMCISAGQLVIIKPGTKYSYHGAAGQNVQYLWIHFSGKAANETVLKFNLTFNNIMNIGIRQRLFESWQHMFYEFLNNDKFFKESSCCILNEILIMFSRYLNDDGKSNRLFKALFYIHEHFNTDIGIEKLAKIENLSEACFRSEFKKIMKMSPKEYIINLRIETACTLLSENNVSVGEAASAVGYTDAYYFSRIFKKKTGSSPMQYKKMKS